MTAFIIEHLEPELWKWCMVEYTHISEFVGKENLIFTNVKDEKEQQQLEQLGTVHTESVHDLQFKNMVILDPNAKETLKPSDKQYDYILLGGILGDFPPKKRTKKELTDKLDGYPVRNLTEKQMSTNTAAYVAWKILTGTPITDITFKQSLVVPTGEGEEVELPFQFVEENGELVLAKGYLDLIKEGDF